MIKYCVGIIGGRPSHALYFIGIVGITALKKRWCCLVAVKWYLTWPFIYLGDELIYLDPHICQPVVDFDVEDDQLDDSSYHCPFVLRMPLVNMETSLALGFFCRNEAELRDLLNCFRKVSGTEYSILMSYLRGQQFVAEPFESLGSTVV